MTFPGLFAELAKAYRSHYRIPEEEFRKRPATVSAIGYLNGSENILAQFGPGGKPARLGLFTAQSILDLPDEGKKTIP